MDTASTSFDPTTQTLEDVLRVVGHSPEECKEKSSQIQQFILQLTIADLITKAPKQLQDKLIAESKKNPDRKKTLRLFQHNFKQEDVMDSYQSATYTIMREYFTAVSPQLTTEQKTRIATIFQKQYSDLTRK